METNSYHKYLIIFLAGSLFFVTNVAESATLFLSPGSGNFLVGSTFDLSIILDTKAQPVNIIEAELFFPPDKLQLASPSVGKSIIQIWPTPPIFSNKDGRVYLVGGVPAPGINTSEGVVLTLTFRVVSTGEGEVRFGEKTSVLAHDGAGTDVLSEAPPSFFRFTFPPSLGPRIFSPTHPDQGTWYQDNSPVFIWDGSQVGEAYSFNIDGNPRGFPDTTEDSTATTTSFRGIANGIWYFHLREKANGVWSGASHYAVKIDNEPPASFAINVSPSEKTSNRSPIFRFSPTDALSGVDKTEMKIVSLYFSEPAPFTFFETVSPYQAINWGLGRYQVIVRAMDRAGNTRDETVTVSVVGQLARFIGQEGVDLIFVFMPWIWIILAIAFVLVAVTTAFFNLWLNHRHHLRHAFIEDIEKLLKVFKGKNRNQ